MPKETVITTILKRRGASAGVRLLIAQKRRTEIRIDPLPRGRSVTFLAFRGSLCTARNTVDGDTGREGDPESVCPQFGPGGEDPNRGIDLRQTLRGHHVDKGLDGL